MQIRSKTSQYFLTKEKKLEIHEKGQVYRSAVPVRYTLNPVAWLKNCLLTFIRHKKKLRSYDVLDLKDNCRKKLYLTHNEIVQVWNHPTTSKNKTPNKTKNNRRK